MTVNQWIPIPSINPETQEPCYECPVCHQPCAEAEMGGEQWVVCFSNDVHRAQYAEQVSKLAPLESEAPSQEVAMPTVEQNRADSEEERSIAEMRKRGLDVATDEEAYSRETDKPRRQYRTKAQKLANRRRAAIENLERYAWPARRAKAKAAMEERNMPKAATATTPAPASPTRAKAGTTRASRWIEMRKVDGSPQTKDIIAQGEAAGMTPAQIKQACNLTRRARQDSILQVADHVILIPDGKHHRPHKTDDGRMAYPIDYLAKKVGATLAAAQAAAEDGDED